MNNCNDCEHLQKEPKKLFPYDMLCAHPDAPHAKDMAARRTIHSTTLDMRSKTPASAGFCRVGESCSKFEQAKPPKSAIDKKLSALHWLAFAALVYVAAAMLAYRFRNPEQTETELLFNLWEALSWN